MLKYMTCTSYHQTLGVWKEVELSTPTKYPEEYEGVEASWNKDGAIFTILKTDSTYYPNHYCGYVRFPKRPVIETSYYGILAYVQVHGGITFAEEDKDNKSMAYGFDCAHPGDDAPSSLTRNIDWLIKECYKMCTGISIAAGYEEEYLIAEEYSDEQRNVTDRYINRMNEELITSRELENDIVNASRS